MVMVTLLMNGVHAPAMVGDQSTRCKLFFPEKSRFLLACLFSYFNYVGEMSVTSFLSGKSNIACIQFTRRFLYVYRFLSREPFNCKCANFARAIVGANYRRTQ